MTNARGYRALNPYQSDMFVIHARIGDTDHKLFQVIFRNQEGAIFVNMANYFRHTHGIVALVEYPPDASEPVDIELAGKPESARIVDVLVKYSHHANGYVHFSQTWQTNKALHIHKDAMPL